MMPIHTIEDLRNGKALAAMIHTFERCCKRVPYMTNYYQFVEDWLVSVGDMTYIPNYGSFVRHILCNCDVELIKNIFGIVAMVMYNNQHDLWKTLNVELIFLLLGEPLIPKINCLLNEPVSIEKSEQFALIAENRQLRKRVSKLEQELREKEGEIEEEMKKRELESEILLKKQQNVESILSDKISEQKEKNVELQKIITDLQSRVAELEEISAKRLAKLEAMKTFVTTENEQQIVISSSEMEELHQRINRMQDQMRQLTVEMDEKFNIK